MSALFVTRCFRRIFSYRRPFLTDELALIPGYGRMQGFVFRADSAAVREFIAILECEQTREELRARGFLR